VSRSKNAQEYVRDSVQVSEKEHQIKKPHHTGVLILTIHQVVLKRHFLQSLLRPYITFKIITILMSQD